MSDFSQALVAYLSYLPCLVQGLPRDHMGSSGVLTKEENPECQMQHDKCNDLSLLGIFF